MKGNGREEERKKGKEDREDVEGQGDVEGPEGMDE